MQILPTTKKSTNTNMSFLNCRTGDRFQLATIQYTDIFHPKTFIFQTVFPAGQIILARCLPQDTKINCRSSRDSVSNVFSNYYFFLLRTTLLILGLLGHPTNAWKSLEKVDDNLCQTKKWRGKFCFISVTNRLKFNILFVSLRKKIMEIKYFCIIVLFQIRTECDGGILCEEVQLLQHSTLVQLSDQVLMGQWLWFNCLTRY